MDLATFLRYAKHYNDMGWSVQEQLWDVARGDSMADQNLDALEMIAKFLLALGEDVSDAQELAEDIDRFIATENAESER